MTSTRFLVPSICSGWQVRVLCSGWHYCHVERSETSLSIGVVLRFFASLRMTSTRFLVPSLCSGWQVRVLCSGWHYCHVERSETSLSIGVFEILRFSQNDKFAVFSSFAMLRMTSTRFLVLSLCSGWQVRVLCSGWHYCHVERSETSLSIVFFEFLRYAQNDKYAVFSSFAMSGWQVRVLCSGWHRCHVERSETSLSIGVVLRFFALLRMTSTRF